MCICAFQCVSGFWLVRNKSGVSQDFGGLVQLEVRTSNVGWVCCVAVMVLG